MRCSQGKRWGVVVVLLLLTLVAWGQADTVSGVAQMSPSSAKVVEVSRVFDPWISDAGKINFLPQLDDTVVVSPKFEYHLSARPLVRLLPLRPIPPAKMGRVREEKLSPFYLKIGGGNNYSPWLEGYISGGRSERLSYSLEVSHFSSWGTLVVGDRSQESEQDVDAPYSRTGGGGELRGFSKKHRLRYYVRGGYRHRYSSFYGLGDTLVVSQDTLWKSGYSRHVGGVVFEVGSTHLDSSHFQYLARGEVSGYADNFSGQEWHVGARLEGYKDFDGQRYGGVLSVRHYGLSLGEVSHPNTIVSLAPWVKLSGDRWRVLAGVDLTYDANGAQSEVHVYPRGHVSYDIIRQYFIPYFEVDGRLEVADRVTLSETNPFLHPREKVWNSSRNMELRFGARGKFSNDFGFHVYGAYGLVDSMRFSVNGIAQREMTPLHYQTGLVSPMRSVYDRGSELHLAAELHYALTSRFAAGLRGDYSSYSLIQLAAPWHIPTVMGTLFANYNLRDKIYAGLDFHVSGGRKALDADGKAIDLPSTFDLNLQARYRVGVHTSVFVDFRNLLFQRTYLYNLYPSHRLQAYGGIILAF